MHMGLHVSVVAHAALVGTWIIGAEGLAAAQAPADPREQARSHVGPFYATPTVTLEELGLDTNVFNTSDPKADFTSTLVPHADVWVPLGQRGLITTSSTVSLIYYQAFTSERSINPAVSLRGDLRLNRLTLFGNGAYSRSRRRPNLEIDARAQHEQTGVEAGLTVKMTERLSLALSAIESHLAFDQDATYNSVSLQETLNQRMRSASSAVRYELTPLTRVFVRAQVGEDRFPFSPVRNADSASLVPGVEFQPRALISGSAAVGVRRFQPHDSSLPDNTGVVATANLAYSLRTATRFRFTATHDLAYSYSDTQPYYGLAAYGLAVTRHLGGRFSLTASGDWETHNYRRLTTAAVPQASAPLPAAVDRIRMWSASMGYRLARSRRLGFGASYRQRDSNSTEINGHYSGLRIMATVDSEL